MADQEKTWLIDYCTRSENIELALRIVEIGPDLEVALVRSFLEKLAESVDEELGKRSPGLEARCSRVFIHGEAIIQAGGWHCL